MYGIGALTLVAKPKSWLMARARPSESCRAVCTGKGVESSSLRRWRDFHVRATGQRADLPGKLYTKDQRNLSLFKQGSKQQSPKTSFKMMGPTLP